MLPPTNWLCESFFLPKSECYIHESLRKKTHYRSSRPEVFCKKETLAEVFSCEFCEIFKNTLCYRTLLVAASVIIRVWVNVTLFAICDTLSDAHCNIFFVASLVVIRCYSLYYSLSLNVSLVYLFINDC